MAAPDFSRLPYRPCVGVALFNKAGLVFVGQRIDATQEAWQMPQGGIDEGEDPERALFRELEEEIGTSAAEIIEEIPNWLTYDLPPELLGRVWKGQFRGQRQKWYAMRFLGQDSDINIATHHPEFHSWRWMPLADLPALIVPFKRGIYEEVARRFAHLTRKG